MYHPLLEFALFIKFIISHKRRQDIYLSDFFFFFIIFRRTISSQSYETPCVLYILRGLYVSVERANVIKSRGKQSSGKLVSPARYFVTGLKGSKRETPTNIRRQYCYLWIGNKSRETSRVGGRDRDRNKIKPLGGSQCQPLYSRAQFDTKLEFFSLFLFLSLSFSVARILEKSCGEQHGNPL